MYLLTWDAGNRNPGVMLPAPFLSHVVEPRVEFWNEVAPLRDGERFPAGQCSGGKEKERTERHGRFQKVAARTRCCFYSGHSFQNTRRFTGPKPFQLPTNRRQGEAFWCPNPDCGIDEIVGPLFPSRAPQRQVPGLKAPLVGN